MGKLNRIVLHWTAGGYKANATDKKAYHFIVEDDGKVVEGTHKPEDNMDCKDGKYAAHALNHNTGAIGIAMACRKDNFTQPTPKQVEAFCKLASDLCKKYGIPISNYNILTHMELDPKRKIDINAIPCMGWHGCTVVGDGLRKKIRWYYQIKS